MLNFKALPQYLSLSVPSLRARLMMKPYRRVGYWLAQRLHTSSPLVVLQTDKTYE